MSEYIKKEDTEKAILDCPVSGMLDLINLQTAIINIDTIPSADVVEAVRCKDCKYHEELLNGKDGNVLCWVHGLDVIVDRNGYCNYGEREEQEHE